MTVSNTGDIDPFFAESTEQSRIKTAICTNYFFPWANIIMPRSREKRVAYIDLYAGPGRYVDGTKSTPLLILEKASGNSRMRDMLLTIFNDAKPEHTKSLENAIKELPGLSSLKYQPKIITGEVERLAGRLERPLIPTFAFIDPYGYTGLSLRLVNNVIKDWASECLFFFNYNRINPGVSNPAVAEHMKALFGAARLAALQKAVAGCKPQQREKLVMAALSEALVELGGRYVLPFRFVMEDSDRTSHYLVFVSKEFLGYKIMREVMWKASSTHVEDVASFEHSPRPSLFIEGRSVDLLAEELVTDLAGRMMKVEDVFVEHSGGRLYVMRNYQDALMRLEKAGRVIANPGSGDRREGTLAPRVVITFPRQSGDGAKAPASRSTAAHPGSDPQPSVSARPTA